MKAGDSLRFNTKSLKFKIIFFSALCVLIAGVLSNLFVYYYMNGIIINKVESIDSIYLNNIQQQLDANLKEVHDLASLCSYDVDVANFLGKPYTDPSKDGQAALRIQKLLNAYLNSGSVQRYIQRLIVFNEDGVSVHASTTETGNLDDVRRIMETSLYKERKNPSAHFKTVYPSIVPESGDCLAALYNVENPGVPVSNSYLYIEVKLDILTDILSPYTKLNDIFIVTDDGHKILPPDRVDNTIAQKVDISSLTPGEILKIGGIRYRIYTQKLNTEKLTVYSGVNMSNLDLDSKKILYTVIITIITSLVVTFGILVIVSNYITRPVRKLIKRIKKISDDNDFSYDPEIERSKDEIGAIGCVVNDMSVSIQNLLKETIQSSEERKNIEIALLQSQVNPHFLYNTLDSINWMAVIQKNTGISNVTRSLINLLKNMAKGFSGKITLSEELLLLKDYTTIQSIRYLETFEVVNNIDQRFYSYYIIKMTLQPIVENAIFHGIEPTGNCGIITLDAYEDSDFLYITVHDNGAGMTEEEIHTLMTKTKQHTKDSMNGIGVANVDKRLKLIYGKECGLTIESKKGEYTLVTVKIRKETEGNV